MRILNDIGNAMSRLAIKTGHGFRVIVGALVEAVIGTVEAMAGVLRRPVL